MAYCNNCKEEKPDDQKFCNTCGAELAASAPDQPAAQEAQPPAAQPAAPQPVYTAQQFQQHKAEAMNIFSKLGLGLQIAVIGAIVSFVFTLITTIQLSSNPFAGLLGAMMGASWLTVILSAGAVVLIYFASLNTGKTRTMMIAGVIAIGGMWLPSIISGWSAGLYVIAMLGGLAQLVGGFMALNESA